MLETLSCPACQGRLTRAALTPGTPQPCPLCRAVIYAVLFPAADLPAPPLQTGEPLTSAEDAACFHHADRKAAAVCAECGRFLCRLCDLDLPEGHFCATCLERIRKAGTEPCFVTSRLIYKELSLTLALLAWLGLFFLAPLAWVLAWRHRHDPGSLVHPRPWLVPAALTLSTLHMLGLITLLIFLAVR
ncbi:MAG: hypothetical protein N3J91_13990 [Verrucomicrobiae bacterium]|nr:hypothetical protein [Verrucomicrobiae bacterium]